MKAINRVLFIGSKQIGLQILREIYSLSPETLIGILTIDDSDDNRSVLMNFKHFANQNGIGLHIAKNRKESEEVIRRSGPDLCFVVGWYWFIGSDILDLVPSGFIGIHNSLLPEYRGGSPLVWSIINGEKQVGFSFFSFTRGMDEGNIWAQGSVKIDGQDYISDILKKLEGKTVHVLQENYLKILNGTAIPVEQDHGLATYCVSRSPDDGNINWSKCARDVYNFIRAQSDPYPGAFTYFGSRKLKIWRARLFDKPYYGAPGRIARISNNGVYIICGDYSAIIVEEVGVGEKRGNATELMKSIKGKICSSIVDSMATEKYSKDGY